MHEDREKLRLALLEEFGHAKERWTDVRLELGRRSNDMQIGVSERNFQLILALVSISVVFLTIVIPIAHTQSSISPSSLILPTAFSFFAIIIGIANLFMTTWWDRQCIADDGKWGIESYGRYHRSANEIYSDLYMGSVPKDKIESYEKLFEEIPKEAQKRSEERNRCWQSRTINFLFYAFLVVFLLAFLSLLSVVTPLNTASLLI